VLFEGNSALVGGGFNANQVSGNLSITNTDFIDNLALPGGYAGGAEIKNFNGPIWIADTRFIGNHAPTAGGLYLQQETASPLAHIQIVDSQITANTADSGAAGLGLEDGPVGATILLHNTVIEENTVAGEVIDCHNFAVSGGFILQSIGNTGISALGNCGLNAHPTDQINNLLLNGGFEFGSGTPDDWTVTEAVGDKRKCNSDTKTVAEYGNCSYMFTYSEGELTTLKQNVDLDAYIFDNNDELLLYAMGDGAGASKVNVQVTATYNDTNLEKSKVKLTFSGSNDVFEAVPGAPGSLILLADDLKKLQVKVSNKSTGGKFYLDRVYLFRSVTLAPRLAIEGVTLPLPVVPEGFRGGN
jgi:hypothetical protein